MRISDRAIATRWRIPPESGADTVRVTIDVEDHFADPLPCAPRAPIWKRPCTPARCDVVLDRSIVERGESWNTIRAVRPGAAYGISYYEHRARRRRLLRVSRRLRRRIVDCRTRRPRIVITPECRDVVDGE